MNKNKIIYGGKVLLDLTEDTVTTDTLGYGTTAHDKSGTVITGDLVPYLNQPPFLATDDSKLIRFSNGAFIQVKGA